MDYTVGSLADLITGSTTPNKPKVIRKAFKKEIRAEETPNSVDKLNHKKRSLKNVKVNNNIENTKSSKSLGVPGSNDGENTVRKKVKRKKQLDNDKIGEISQQKVKLENEIHLPKKKKRKLPLETDEFGDASQKKIKLDTQSEKTKTLSKKKRKLEKDETGNLADSDDDLLLPEKETLSHNEHNAGRRVKKKDKEKERVIDLEELARTIFVGNVPIQTDKKKVKQHFKKYGKIESLRFRGIPVADPKTSKKVAAIKKEFHPDRRNIYCYIRFANAEDALSAEAENGALFQEHHLRVHSCKTVEKPDETKAIFVGNLSFDAEEDELWKLFEPCGPISYVRIVRDSYTGMGKGFAYINFKDSDAVQLALEMENVKQKNRELRISLCNLNVARKNRKQQKKKKITQPGQSKLRKPFNKNFKNGAHTSDGQNLEEKSTNKHMQNNKGFQGPKFKNEKKISQPGQQKFRKPMNRNFNRSDNKFDGENVQEKRFRKQGQNNKGFQDSKFKKEENVTQAGQPNVRQPGWRYWQTGEHKSNGQNTNEQLTKNKGFEGSKFTDKKKKFKTNKGLLEKKRKIKKIAPKTK